MKPREQLKDILAWVLKAQVERTSAGHPDRSPSSARMEAALRGRPGFNDQERSALLRSPAGRARLRFFYEALRADQLLRWRELAVEESLTLRAAAGGPVEPVALSNQDISLTLLPLDPQGREWMLHLKLVARLVTGLSGVPLRVRDEQGQTWLTGLPDADGELSGPWLLGGSPVESLATTRLFLEPA